MKERMAPNKTDLAAAARLPCLVIICTSPRVIWCVRWEGQATCESVERQETGRCDGWMHALGRRSRLHRDVLPNTANCYCLGLSEHHSAARRCLHGEPAIVTRPSLHNATRFDIVKDALKWTCNRRLNNSRY